MLINYDKQIKTLSKIQRGEIVEGLKLGIPQIDEFYRHKPRSFNICLGHANTGKTSLVLYMMLLYSIKHNQKWLIYSSENEPVELIQKLLEFYCEQPLNKIIPEDYKNGLKWVEEHFQFINPSKLYSYKSLLDEMKVLKKIFNYDGVLVDPYNSLIKDKKMLNGLGAHEYDYEATTEIRMFCKKNNVSLYLCCHANTDALRQVYKDGEFAGYPKVCESSHAEGGGKWINRSDHFWSIHRFIQHPVKFLETQLHIKKVKNISSGGRCTPLEQPILFKAITNNVGYSINNESLVKKLKLEKAPF